MSLSKMEQAKVLEKEITEIRKKKTLMENIVGGFQSAGMATAPVCIKVNPQYSNYMALEKEYLPMTEESFMAGYLLKINNHLSAKESELEELFN